MKEWVSPGGREGQLCSFGCRGVTVGLPAPSRLEATATEAVQPPSTSPVMEVIRGPLLWGRWTKRPSCLHSALADVDFRSQPCGGAGIQGHRVNRG